MEHTEIAQFARTFGLVFMVALFVIALAYALWPRNRDKFARAARLPLKDD